jgi:putative SOS response-associated peptidase YedK
MCGRFNLRTPASRLVEVFQLLRTPELSPRYNIAPTQSVAVVRLPLSVKAASPGSRQSITAGDGSRQNITAGYGSRQKSQLAGRDLTMMRWGLVPSWSKDPKSGPPLINARADTVATKPTFRSAFRSRRCLIPADGFYEWQKTDTTMNSAGYGSRPIKQPFHIRLNPDHPFAFAGLWERWEGADSSAIESCTIITTDANDLLRPIHDRMPVILHEEDYDRWLDPNESDAKQLESLLRPFPPEEMTAYPIGLFVNNARNDSLQCIAPGDGGLPFPE